MNINIQNNWHIVVDRKSPQRQAMNTMDSAGPSRFHGGAHVRNQSNLENSANRDNADLGDPGFAESQNKVLSKNMVGKSDKDVIEEMLRELNI